MSFSKSEIPNLPSEFKSTIFRTPNWIAQTGAIAQYRASSALHAYEFEDWWRIHHDHFDPKENPVGHFFVDAPELPIAAFLSVVAGFLTYFTMNRREKRKPEEERSWWLPAVVAIFVAAIVGVATYILGAIVRVALSAE